MEKQQAGRGMEGTAPRTPPEATLTPGVSIEEMLPLGRAA